MSMMELSMVFMVTCGLFLMGMLSQIYEKRSLQRTIDRQQDTIQRLINREPVTYQETGQKPVQPNKERFAAWGNQMVDIDEETQ